MIDLCCLTILIVIIVWIILAILPKQKIYIEKEPKRQIRYCPDCGREIPWDTRTCPYCSKKFW